MLRSFDTEPTSARLEVEQTMFESGCGLGRRRGGSVAIEFKRFLLIAVCEIERGQAPRSYGKLTWIGSKHVNTDYFTEDTPITTPVMVQERSPKMAALTSKQCSFDVAQQRRAA